MGRRSLDFSMFQVQCDAQCDQYMVALHMYQLHSYFSIVSRVGREIQFLAKSYSANHINITLAIASSWNREQRSQKYDCKSLTNNQSTER